MQALSWWPASALAVSSAVLQVVGYGFYLHLILRRKIDPNPTSWLMFAYGTSLIVVLESAAGASWRELALPVVCAAASVAVAGTCWSRGTLRWPRDGIELYSFAADVAITIAFVAWWAIGRVGILSRSEMAVAVPAFLVLWNVGTIAAFTPIVVSTWRDPTRESWAPWIVWTLAYATLAFVTFIEEGVEGNLFLYLYPLSNVLVHGSLAILSLNLPVATKLQRRNTAHSRPQMPHGASSPSLDFLYVAETKYTGHGLFTRRAFKKGDHVCNITGTIRKYVFRTREDSLLYPNWYQIDEDLWCDPDYPFNYFNHSCGPNCVVVGQSVIALRDIQPGDELTCDYSLIDSDEHWEMGCSCQTPNCRGVIRSIQFLPRKIFDRYEPHLVPYFRQAYEAAQRSGS
ncbi:MAG: SET domain-containing protein-lysine N-methyltransferase [Rhizobiales bacterium]|nr:SET domain-containing protein-lysine N-methyltransferase [Hyphomicrobiales bacterium]